MKKLVRTIGILLAAVTLLSSCALFNAEQESGPYYIPEDEWNGLETGEYDEIYARYVSACETGSPDPEPEVSEGDYPETYEVEFIPSKLQYSLSEDSKVSLTVTRFATGDESADGRMLDLHRYLNLERWDGTEWKRMITTQNYFTQSVVSERDYLAIEETEAIAITLDSVVTRLIPGKYRAVAYINYKPIYAEFELVE